MPDNVQQNIFCWTTSSKIFYAGQCPAKYFLPDNVQHKNYYAGQCSVNFKKLLCQKMSSKK